MLRRIRHSLLALIQRPVGRLGGLLMVAAMVSAGIPNGELHAHAEAYDSHEHVVVMADVDHAVAHEHSSPVEPDGVELLHSHDACISVSALLPIPAMVADLGDLVVVPLATTVAAAPLTSWATPYRPPIA